MYVLVAPISGGAFPAQLKFLLELSRLHRQYRMETYDVALAASGGNVAVYLGLMAHLDMSRVAEVVSKITPARFLSSWWSPPLSYLLPSWLWAYSQGSLYNHGCGVEDLFSQDFPIDHLEVWTGVYNHTQGKAELFTNVTPAISRLPSRFFNPQQYDALPLRYLGNDRRTLAKVCYASAAIPTYVPNVEINGQYYADGGTVYSSPLTLLQDCLNSAEVLHLDYLSSYDLESDEQALTYHQANFYQNSKGSLATLVKSLGLQDRNVGVELIGHQNVRMETGEVTPDNLVAIIQRRWQHSRSFLEIYPKKQVGIALDSFRPEDILTKMVDVEEVMAYRLWYN